MSTVSKPGVRVARIQDLVNKYSQRFFARRIIANAGQDVGTGEIVALTGSTGNLGCVMLYHLLKRPATTKIYVLNRQDGELSRRRIKGMLREKGLDDSVLDTSKTTYLHINFGKPDLGLGKEVYEDLRDNVTHIIHSAWLLNFSLPVDKFESVHIAGVRHLIDLALASPRAVCPRLVFLSSLAAAVEYQGASEVPLVGETLNQPIVPEGPVDNPEMAVKDQGYGESKYVSERIIVKASENAGLRATVIRIGQLSGMTTNGEWPDEYTVLGVRTSLLLGIWSNDMPRLRWIPCDIAASAVIKQSFHDSSALQYFSIENPYPMDWQMVENALKEGCHTPLTFVPYRLLINSIKQGVFDSEDTPILQVIDFMESRLINFPEKTAALGWNKSVEIAPELKFEYTKEHIKNYIRYQQMKLQRRRNKETLPTKL